MAIRTKRETVKYNRKKAIEHNGLFPYMRKYLEHETIKNRTAKAIETRDSAIRNFIKFCDDREIHDAKDITRQVVERYQRYLFIYRKRNGEPLSPNTQASLLSALKQFFQWLTRQNYILYNPASEIELPRVIKSLPREVLTVAEIEKIFAVPDITTPDGFSDRAALELLYATAIRRAELTNLKVHDVDLKRKIVFINSSKTSTDRFVPIGERASRWLEKYFFDIRKLLAIEPDCGYFFLTPYGTQWHTITFGNKIRRYIQKANLGKSGGAHLFRHAAATHLLEAGVSIRYIQRFLGHAALSSTEIYTHVSLEKLTSIHTASHPLSTFEKSKSSRDILSFLELESDEEDMDELQDI